MKCWEGNVALDDLAATVLVPPNRYICKCEHCHSQCKTKKLWKRMVHKITCCFHPPRGITPVQLKNADEKLIETLRGILVVGKFVEKTELFDYPRLGYFSAKHIQQGLDTLKAKEITKGSSCWVYRDREVFPPSPSSDSSIRDFLMQVLADGPVNTLVVFQEAKKAGLSKSSVIREKEAMGAKSTRLPDGWYWSFQVQNYPTPVPNRLIDLVCGSCKHEWEAQCFDINPFKADYDETCPKCHVKRGRMKE
jgi:hypothetical protein